MDNVVIHHADCWLAHNGYHIRELPMPPCEGALVRVHLVKRQTLERKGVNPLHPATWVWGCGGPMGNGGHHGMLDHSMKLRIPFDRLPAELLEFAHIYDLTTWLEKRYARP